MIFKIYKIRKIIPSLLLLSFAVISLFLYFLNKQMKDYSNVIRQEERSIETEFINRNKELNEKLSNSKVQNVMIEDIKSNQCSLSDLATTNPILIYRYSELNCNTCYETETILLKSIFENYQNKVVILCSYEMRQHFMTFKRINRISFPIYRIAKDAFDWELEDYSEPYYFVLHPDMRISRIYMPNINYPEMNKQYLEGIKRFLIN